MERAILKRVLGRVVARRRRESVSMEVMVRVLGLGYMYDDA